MKPRKALSFTDEQLSAINSLFAVGGLEHSPHHSRPRSTVSAKSKKTGPNALEKTTSENNERLPQVLRVPQWDAYPWLVHGFSTRVGGVSDVYSPARCGELNLGFTVSDAKQRVRKNRELFLQATLGRFSGKKRKSLPPLALLQQIHSGLIHRADEENSYGEDAPPPRGDGWITALPGVLLAIQTADCIPVLVADVRQRVVAAFHAGWRGTMARIVQRGVGRMRAELGCQPEDLVAAIGPGIGACCYSVGEEVRMEFSSQFSYSDALFHEVFDLDPIKEKYPMLFLTARAPGHSNLGPSTHLNLMEANRRQLLDAGLPESGIQNVGLCTACNVNRFFSHRAEHGFTGRMLSVIGVSE